MTMRRGLMLHNVAHLALPGKEGMLVMKKKQKVLHFLSLSQSMSQFNRGDFVGRPFPIFDTRRMAKVVALLCESL